jgi:hypothetical protein
MRQVASGLSYNGREIEASAKHWLLDAASRLEEQEMAKRDAKIPFDDTRKPPLGLMPKHIWIDRRISDIMRAFIRYEDAKLPVPPEWRDELRGYLAVSNPEPSGSEADRSRELLGDQNKENKS